MDFIAIAKEVLQTEANGIIEAMEAIDSDFVEAVEALLAVKGKIVVIGVGKSGLVGAKIAATLSSTGSASFYLHPTEAMHGDLGAVGVDDMALLISFSGESKELLDILPHLGRLGVKSIGMSRSSASSLGQMADYHIAIHISKEACPHQSAPTTSTTATMALGDAIAVCLMRAKNFQKDDFASYHPGGSLGKRLFVKASSLMRTQNLPIITPTTPLKEAIVVMSEGRIGNVLIAEDNRLVAVLSDGDLRRALLRADFDLSSPASLYANPNPKTMGDSSILASDALRHIEASKIQLLVFTHSNQTIEGVLHIHDLIEAGIQ